VERHVTYVGLWGELTSRLGRCESRMWYDLFAKELAIVIVVAVALALVSRWKGLERDECDRYLLVGFCGLLSGMLIPIVGGMGEASIMLGIALFSFMMAWGVKRKAEEAANRTASH